ncbi:MAG: Vms1/Ankzf1 family peptidyl-tRNA hydrolase [Chloroflexota bacterium]|nr:MAG: hypothetical protein DLM70_17370 [Chloroflexota bacterium]
MSIQAEEVRDIVDFAPQDFLVTSFYLDVNAAEFPDPDHVQKSLDSLLHTAREQRDEMAATLSHGASESLRQDLDAIEHWVQEGFDRQDTNGLAIFSCSAVDFWEVMQMPTPVVSRVDFGSHARVAPIATFLSHNKPTAILLADRQNARIFTTKAGEVREWADIERYVPGRSAAGGWSQARYARHRENFAKHNIDHATELMLRLKRAYPFNWLILGAEVQAETELKASLHPYLKDLVIGTIHVRIDAETAEVAAAAQDIEEEAESHLIDNLMSQIQEYRGAGGRGTIGLDETLRALNEQKIHIMLLQEGYSHRGAVCQNCGMLFGTETSMCPACNRDAIPVEDIVEPAVQRAFELGSTVEVATEQDKLVPIGCIGSVMYY